jgi:tetratricopeptide (TPR) repeat protein
MAGLAWALHHVGRDKDALELHDRVLRINQSHFGVDHYYTADAIMNIGLCKQHEGRNAEALEEYKHALKIKEGVLGEGHIDTVVNIGILHYFLTMDDIALQQHEKGLMIKSKVYGERGVNTAHIHMYIGMAYLRQGRYFEALEQYERTLKIRGFCPSTVADAIAGMGDTFYCLERYNQALELYKNVLKIK